MKNHRRQLAWVIGLLLCIFGSDSVATELNGERFADRLAIGGTELHLRGADVLTWAMMFDVYAGAFYLPQGHSGRDWTDPVPKHLELAYFRNIAGADFAKSSDKLLRQNLPPETYQTLETRLQRLYGWFRNVTSGDRYSLSYIPGTGTELRLNGQTLGTIQGGDFANAYFGIWLGENPIKEKFRDRLLGLDD